jgi:hypothetical protein
VGRVIAHAEDDDNHVTQDRDAHCNPDQSHEESGRPILLRAFHVPDRTACCGLSAFFGGKAPDTAAVSKSLPELAGLTTCG